MGEEARFSHLGTPPPWPPRFFIQSRKRDSPKFVLLGSQKSVTAGNGRGSLYEGGASLRQVAS